MNPSPKTSIQSTLSTPLTPRRITLENFFSLLKLFQKNRKWLDRESFRVSKRLLEKIGEKYEKFTGNVEKKKGGILKGDGEGKEKGDQSVKFSDAPEKSSEVVTG
jgi:hypothetical protein